MLYSRVVSVKAGGDGSRVDSFRCGCTIAHEIGGFHGDSGSVKPLPAGIVRLFITSGDRRYVN